MLGDFDAAEEALHDAFGRRWNMATRRRARESARLADSAGRFKAIDGMRRRARFDAARGTAPRADAVVDARRLGREERRRRSTSPDLHLLPPGLAPDAQVALTLREVCGLTTEEIATPFSPAPTLAQRIVRAKSKIRDARIPYQVPRAPSCPSGSRPCCAYLSRVQRRVRRIVGLIRGPTCRARRFVWGVCWSSCCPSRRPAACSP